MPEPGGVFPIPPGKTRTERAIALAEAQEGAISARQLAACGLTRAQIERWIRERRLLRRYRGVYTLGHRVLSVTGRLHAALLYAGADSALSHYTACYWWRLHDAEPQKIHIATRRDVTSVADIEVHRRPNLQIVTHRGLPVTPVADTLADVAARSTVEQLRQYLAQADFRDLLDLDAVAARIGRGKPGSAKLRQAMARHQPELARTASEFERRFLPLIEADPDIPMPEFNASLAGKRVDALWRQQRVAVELDGRDGHASWARIQGDRRRDLRLRALGYIVLRYTWSQVFDEWPQVREDICRALALADAA
jgi:predicted transcriptional regulator of viral defense system